MTKFDPTKPVQTRDGREAEICWTDGGGPNPIGGWYRNQEGNKVSMHWPSNGMCLSSGEEFSSDLINIPEKPMTIERWAVASSTSVRGVYESLEYANEVARGFPGERVILLSSTFTPGEGLTDED